MRDAIIDLLREIAKGPRYRARSFPPAREAVALGYAKWQYGELLVITESGLAALSPTTHEDGGTDA